jgi:PhzF family phenazine biosynthesis protein
MNAIEITQVDAFTRERYKGNPAAICILDQPGDEDWMQQVALEMNLSETAYIVLVEGGYSLRWFTPATEVDLCGHATVAAAHVLWEKELVATDAPCIFHTRSGVLTASLLDGKICVDFPTGNCESIDVPNELSEALGADPISACKNELGYLLVELDSEQSVHDLKPDMSALKKLPLHGCIATAASENESLDFISRFFAPAMGIDEDPVTGSAHCILGLYWKSKLGKNKMEAYQASPRGGYITVNVNGSVATLSGHAITTMRGTLL